MATNSKLTKAEIFALIAEEMADNQMVVEFCEKEIELLKKRKKGSSIETEAFREKVLSNIQRADCPMTNKMLAEVMGTSWQKIAYATRKLEEFGLIESEEGVSPKVYTAVKEN